MNRLKLEALFISIVIYLIIIVTIFTVALYTPSTQKAKNYVEKKSEIIEVSLGSPTKQKSYKNSNKKSKPKKKEPKKKKKVIKKVRNLHKKESKKAKRVKKTVEKRAKKSTKRVKKTSPKRTKQNASSLFKKLPKSIKDDTPVTQNSGKAGSSLKKSNQGKGVVNKYFANVKSKLKGWPAQSNFAGEKVKVELTIYSTGLFDYKILSRSLNPEFNRSLKSYLEQLKRFGFGPHSNPKPYKIVVEFIAK